MVNIIYAFKKLKHRGALKGILRLAKSDPGDIFPPHAGVHNILSVYNALAPYIKSAFNVILPEANEINLYYTELVKPTLGNASGRHISFVTALTKTTDELLAETRPNIDWTFVTLRVQMTAPQTLLPKPIYQGKPSATLHIQPPSAKPPPAEPPPAKTPKIQTNIQTKQTNKQNQAMPHSTPRRANLHRIPRPPSYLLTANVLHPQTKIAGNFGVLAHDVTHSLEPGVHPTAHVPSHTHAASATVGTTGRDNAPQLFHSLTTNPQTNNKNNPINNTQTWDKMNVIKTKDPNSTNQNQTDQPAEASTARWKKSNWNNLHPAIRSHATQLWKTLPLQPEALEYLLEGFPNKETAKILLHATKHGIRVLDPNNPPPPFKCKNAQSANEHKEELRNEINRQLQSYFTPPTELKSNHIHSLSVKISKEKIRAIHNLSSPKGHSINDHLIYLSYNWTKVTDAAKTMYQGCKFIRIDIKDYYRHIPVDPADWHLLAFHFELTPGKTTELWDCFMPFGSRNAVEIAHRFSTFLTWLGNMRGIKNLFTILDDFLIISETDKPTNPSTMKTMIRDLETIGFNVSGKINKTHDWSDNCEWMGIMWSSNPQPKAYLSNDRINTLLPEIETFIKNRNAPNDTLITLIHRLVWASPVVWGLSTHLLHLLKLNQNITGKPSYHHTNLKKPELEELRWIKQNLTANNGKGLYPGDDSPQIWISTDAKGFGPNENPGYGIFISATRHYSLTHRDMQILFPHDCPIIDAPIHEHEAFAILAAARLCHDLIKDKRLGIINDNSAATKMARKLRSKVPKLQAMALNLFTLADKYNFRITRAEHVPGENNQLADSLSRHDLNRFHKTLLNWDGTKPI